MFDKYFASKEDLRVVEEGISYVWHPKMSFVFRKKHRIKNTIVVSYDSKFIYLWTPIKPGSYKFTKISHNLKIKDEWQSGWHAGLWGKIENLLPDTIKKASTFEIPRVGGGLLTPFVSLQKDKGFKTNPYLTRESYLATTVHEFGHVYWNSYKLWWSSNKKGNLSYLNLARDLYQKNSKIPRIRLNFSSNWAFGEIFAFCTEYYASSLFWPKHKVLIDKFAEHRIEMLIEEEKKRNLEREDSVLEPSKNQHDFAFVFGKIILNLKPNDWPQILTTTNTI